MGGNIARRGHDSWRVTLSAGTNPDGTRRYVRSTVRGTRNEAERELMRLTLEVGDGLPEHFSTNRTVADLLEVWIPVAKLAESTRYDYRLTSKHIIDHIGKTPLHKVRPFTLDRFYAKLEADGLGPDRIRRCHTVLRSAFKQAVKWEWMLTNPAINATPPAAPIRDIETLDPAQYRKLAHAANETLFLAAVAIHIAGNIGSRRGEICGLQWSDFDLDAGNVRVLRTVGVVPGVGDVVKPVKGNVKRRLEPKGLDDATVEMMRLWDMATADHRDIANPDGWVFQSPGTGSFYRPDVMGRMFRQIATAAGLPGAHMHQLRHYVVTMLRDAGVDLDAVSRRVGHARTSTTVDIYGHAVSKSNREAAEVMGRINRGE